MIDEKFIFLGVFISFIGGVSYLISTIKGETKPNKVTWFLWTVAPFIAFFSQIKQGVGLSSLLAFMTGFNPLLIFCASFINKKAYWKISNFDLICGFLSLAGIALWYITKIGDLAIIFSIFADALASIPTLIKSYKAPETENYLIFFLGAINAVIVLLTLKVWNISFAAFPIYILLINVALTALIKFKPRKYLHF
ncbi:hypothetical protein C4559_02755 [Candidatus Microgenomates bacterium]|nr:MAG: hypothetical protein C4559_02755 [Candidatus Microgenomates bacterium]